MAKDTEKLIRQLSLISYLMAERRPVTALEIRRDVEGYSEMNEDAFARRFYADRAELESLGISLTVDKPSDGGSDQESYSLRPENFFLPAIEFSDSELAALSTALSLLDGEFAYAEPLRLALQQITWGQPSPLTEPVQRSVTLGITGSAGGHDRSQRLAKLETAIFRRKTVTFSYHSIARDETSDRKVDPYMLLFQGSQFYLVGHSHERDATRVFRLSRIQGKVAYATKAEHDFARPKDFDPREYSSRSYWQLGENTATAEIEIDERIAWQVERIFGRFGQLEPATATSPQAVFKTTYADPRLLISWLLGLGAHAQIRAPFELAEEFDERVKTVLDLHTGVAIHAAALTEQPEASTGNENGNSSKNSSAIRPERFARLVTLASILIQSGRSKKPVSAAVVCEQLKISEEELIEDVNVLNVVNFGGGSYVLYAEILPNGDIEVDPEPYSDNFARPARLLPVEAKALVAAIDLIGEHIPQGSLTSVREKIVAALGTDPSDYGLRVAHAQGHNSEIAAVISHAIAERKLLEIEYYKEHEDEFSLRTIEPQALTNGREGWYVIAFDQLRQDLRHFRLDRVKRAELTDQTFTIRPDLDPLADASTWQKTGEVPTAERAIVWVSPSRARWAREERTVVSELDDGSVVVELSYASQEWLVKEILKEAGDAAVLEPASARDAVRSAAESLLKKPQVQT